MKLQDELKRLAVADSLGEHYRRVVLLSADRIDALESENARLKGRVNIGSLRERFRQAIENASEMLHDSQLWFDDDFTNSKGQTQVDILLDVLIEIAESSNTEPEA